MLAACLRPRPRFSSNALNALRTSARALATDAPARRVIFSGIQPTGTPHLGNYLGALSNWTKLQREAAPDDVLLFSVVGWHALTLPQDPAELRNAREDMMAVLLAIGLDPDRSIIFHQDHNPDHTELAWIFNCITPMGKLKRMTTWKSRLATARAVHDESQVDEGMLHVGLFDYPVLQAADILAYKATHVPVGEDQQQHLELCRDIADLFNRTFKGSKPLFPAPQHLFTPHARILSLRDPSSKMSKSAPDPRSRILLTDTSSQIATKLGSSVTDSLSGITYDPSARPGLANLLAILAACSGSTPEAEAARYSAAGAGFAQLKKDVAEAVDTVLRGPREEYERLRGDRGYLRDVARKGAQKAREISGETIGQVRGRIGLN